MKRIWLVIEIICFILLKCAKIIWHCKDAVKTAVASFSFYAFAFFPTHLPERGNTLFYIMIAKWLCNNIDFGSCKFSLLVFTLQCGYSVGCVFVTLQIISKPSSLCVQKKCSIHVTTSMLFYAIWMTKLTKIWMFGRNNSVSRWFSGQIQSYTSEKKNIFSELMWSDSEKKSFEQKKTNGHVFQMLVHVFLWLNGRLKLRMPAAMLWNI